MVTLHMNRVVSVQTVRRSSGQAMVAPLRPASDRPTAADGCRYRAIGSFQALALAIVAAILTTGLLWLVL